MIEIILFGTLCAFIGIFADRKLGRKFAKKDEKGFYLQLSVGANDIREDDIITFGSTVGKKNYKIQCQVQRVEVCDD